MADYINRDLLMQKAQRKCGRKCAECDFAQDEDTWCDAELFGVEILQQPAADVAPVVRCKECRKCDHDDDTGFYWCTEPLGTLGAIRVPETFYCAFGAKKKDE